MARLGIRIPTSIASTRSGRLISRWRGFGICVIIVTASVVRFDEPCCPSTGALAGWRKSTSAPQSEEGCRKQPYGSVQPLDKLSAVRGRGRRHSAVEIVWLRRRQITLRFRRFSRPNRFPLLRRILRRSTDSPIRESRDILGPLRRSDRVAYYRADVPRNVFWVGVPQSNDFIRSARCENGSIRIKGDCEYRTCRPRQRSQDLRTALGVQTPDPN